MKRIALGLMVILVVGLYLSVSNAQVNLIKGPKRVTLKIVGSVTKYKPSSSSGMQPAAKAFECTAYVKEKKQSPKPGTVSPAPKVKELKVRVPGKNAKKLCAALKKAHNKDQVVTVSYKVDKFFDEPYNKVLSVMPFMNFKPVKPMKPVKVKMR